MITPKNQLGTTSDKQGNRYYPHSSRGFQSSKKFMIPLRIAPMKHETNLPPQLQSNMKNPEKFMSIEKWILLESSFAFAAPFTVKVMVRIKCKGKNKIRNRAQLQTIIIINY